MNNDFHHMDEAGYLNFTGRQQIDKAFNTLEGLLKGVGIDGRIEPAEAKELSDWCDGLRKYAGRHPFNEIIPKVREALADGVLTSEELLDLQWVCSKITRENPYFDAVTADIQRLQGMVHGIIADGRIEKEELDRLEDWMSENEHLNGCYPYDELNTVISAVLKDGKIDEQEHENLLKFFHSFVSFSTAKQVQQSGKSRPSKKELTLPAICSSCPTIVFPGRYFCFTGFSSKGLRSDFAMAVTELKGIYVDKVEGCLNYLVVGAMANPAWAFSCYGRKIETAMNQRKAGRSLLIVHENDFWDSYQDVKAGVT